MEQEIKKPESITYTQSFGATIYKPKGSAATLLVKSQRWYQFQLNKFKNGEDVTLVIHNKKPKRTEQQNRYYWGAYLPKIVEETGESNIDRLHELFKGKFLTLGIVEVLGEKVRIKKSTTELSKSEFSQYIMDIESLTGVQAPPTENYDLISFDKELTLLK